MNELKAYKHRCVAVRKFERTQNVIPMGITLLNTAGTAGGPGCRDRTLALQSRKNGRKIRESESW